LPRLEGEFPPRADLANGFEFCGIHGWDKFWQISSMAKRVWGWMRSSGL
jgi:hypothetical protein